MIQKIPLDQEYDIKISQFIKIFKENGIEPKDIKDKNLALSENGELVAVDYGNFTVIKDWPKRISSANSGSFFDFLIVL